MDFDVHPLTPGERAQSFNAGARSPIIIQNDVFLGIEGLIMKGVTIGEGAVVGGGRRHAERTAPGGRGGQPDPHRAAVVGTADQTLHDPG